jgi:hypothetical protein
MMTFLVEWTLRSIALGLVVWLLLKALRIKSPQLERGSWRAVLVASLSMPLLMKLAEISPAPSATFSTQAVEFVLLPAQEFAWHTTAALVTVLLVSSTLVLRQAW